MHKPKTARMYGDLTKKPEFGKLMAMLSPLLAKPRWKHRSGATTRVLDLDPKSDHREGGGEAIVCARCAHEITHKSAQIRVADLHEHSQVNPGGFIWNFRCFRSAPGCVPFGSLSSEFSWFPGYTWQIQHCGGCNLHLGWLFSSAGDSFVGLISERIVELRRG